MVVVEPLVVVVVEPLVVVVVVGTLTMIAPFSVSTKFVISAPSVEEAKSSEIFTGYVPAAQSSGTV